MKCTYATPCGWCTKWNKKCDKKIRNSKDKDLRKIKSGCGLTSSDTRTTTSSGIKTDITKMFGEPRKDMSYFYF